MIASGKTRLSRQHIGADATHTTSPTDRAAPKGKRSAELLRFIEAEIARSGTFPSATAMQRAMGWRHSASVEDALLRLMAGGFITRQVVASRAACAERSLTALLTNTNHQTRLQQPTKGISAMIDLKRPEGCPNEWEAVVAIGYAPDGPWVIHVVKQPARTFANAHKHSPETVAVALRWLPTAAQAEGFARYMENIIRPPERGLFMRGFQFSMPREQLEKLFAETARVLRSPELDLDEFA